MNTVSKVMIAVLICIVSFSYGCAKPDDQKRDAVANANAAFSDLRTSMDAANSMGSPSTDWSEEKLAAYDNLMTRIEASANRAQSFDGKSGIVIKEIDGLAEAKSSAAFGQTSVKKVRAQKLAKRRFDLIQGLQIDIAAMSVIPTGSWSLEAVGAQERVADHAESAGKQLAFLAVSNLEADLALKVAKLVEIQRSAIETARRH